MQKRRSSVSNVNGTMKGFPTTELTGENAFGGLGGDAESGNVNPASASVTTASEEDSFLEWLEKGWQNTKDAAAGVLLLLSRNCSEGYASAIFSIVIESIQLQAFALSPLLYDSSDDFISKVVYFSDVSNIAVWLFGYDVCVYFSVTIVFLILINTFYVGFGWYRKVFNVLWPIKLLRWLVMVFMGSFFIPIIQIFARIYSCSVNGLDNEAGASCSVFPPLVTFLAIFYILFALAIGSTYFDPTLTSKSPNACSHTRITVFHIFAKITLSGIHAVWEEAGVHESTTAELVRHMILIVFSFSLTYMYIWYQPFYMNKINTYHACTNAILAWFSLIMFLQFLQTTVGEEAYENITFSLVVGLVMVIPMTILAVSFRQQRLMRTDLTQINSSYEFELRIRLFLLKHHPLLKESSTSIRNGGAVMPSDPFLDGIGKIDKSKGKKEHEAEEQELQAFGGALFLNSRVEDDNVCQEDATTRLTRKERLILDRVQEAYQMAQVKFSSSAQVCMFHIYFLKSFYQKDRGMILSRDPLILARKRKPIFDVEFGLFKIQSELELNVTSGQEVVSFVACEKYEREAKNYDRMACWQLLEFWEEFECPHPDMTRIQQLSRSIAEYSAKASTAYERLLKLQPDSPKVLRLYGSFLYEVVNDKLTGSQILNKADGILVNKNGHRLQAQQGMPVYGEQKLDPVIIFEIGIRDNDHHLPFGEITYVNRDAANLLNNVSHKVVGRSIQDYLVSPFKEDLDALVMDFFAKGVSPFFNQYIDTFLVTSDHTCIQIRAQFAPYTNNGVDYTMFLSFQAMDTHGDQINDQDRDHNRFGIMDDDGGLGDGGHHNAARDSMSFCSGEFSVSSDESEQPSTGYFVCNSMQGYKICGMSKTARMLLDRFTAISSSNETLHMDDIIASYSAKRKDLIEKPGDCDLACLSFSSAQHVDQVLVEVTKLDYEGYVMDKVTITVYLAKGEDDSDLEKNSKVDEEIDDDQMSSERGEEPSEMENRPTFGAANMEQSFSLKPGASFRLNETSFKFGHTRGDQHAASFRVGGSRTESKNQDGKSPLSPKSPGSVQSGASGSSAGSNSTNATRYIQKLAAQESSRKTSPMLRRLTRAYILTLGAVVLVAVIYFFWQERNLELYSNEVAFLNSAGFRRFNAVSLAYCVHGLYMLNMGMHLPDSFTEEQLRKDMVTNLESLKKIEKGAFEGRARDAEMNDLYETKQTPILQLSETLDSYHTEYKTLYDVTLYLTSVASQLAEEPLENFHLDNPKVFLLLTQIYGESYLHNLNRTTFILQRVAETRIYEMIPLFWVSVSLAVILQGLLLKFFIWPLVVRIEKNKIEVLEVLRSIPINSVQIISKRCKVRLINTHEVASDVIDGQNVEVSLSSRSKSGVGGTARARRKHKKVTGVLGTRYGSQHYAYGDARQGVCGMILYYITCGCIRTRMLKNRGTKTSPDGDFSSKKDRDVAAIKHRMKKMQEKSSFRAQIAVIARLSLPGLATVLFYMLNFVLGFHIHLEYLLQVPTSVNYSGLRRATLRFAKAHVYLFLAGTRFANLDNEFQIGIENVSHAFRMIEHVNHVLMEGNEDTKGLLKSVNDDQDQIRIWLQDGCHQWVVRFGGPNSSMCETFMSGRMNGGLYAAVHEFIGETLALMQHKEPEIGNLNATSDEELDELMMLEGSYLQNQFIQSVVFYVNDAKSKLQDNEATRNYMLILFLVSIFLLYVGMIRQIIKSLDNELKRTRRLLLMVPIDLYQKLPALRHFLAKEYKKVN